MKVAIISAILIGFAAAQSTTVWDARTKFCTAANETAACAGLTDACCGSITTKVGTAANVVSNRCISRHLVDDFATTTSYGTGASATTVTYACLSTAPTGYAATPRCQNETTCSSGYCCANTTYAIQQSGQTARNATFNQCVPGSAGKDSGSVVSFLWGHPALTGTIADVNIQSTCYASLNSNFYASGSSNAALLKSVFAMVFVGLLALAF